MKNLVFVLFLFLVTIFAVASHRTEKAQASLVSLGEQAKKIITGDPKQRFPLLQVRQEHLDIILEGTVMDEASMEEAIALLRRGDKEAGIEGVPAGVIRNEIRLVILKKPTLRAEMTPGAIRVQGQVPTPELRSAIRTSLNGLGGNLYISISGLKDSPHVDGGDWLGNMPSFLTKFFRGATEGTLELTENRLILKRRLDDPNLRDALAFEARRLVPASITVVEQFSVEEAPSELVIWKQDGAWILSGEVPDKATQDLLLRSIRGAETALSIKEAKFDASALKINPALAKLAWGDRLQTFLKVFLREVGDNPHITVIGDRVILRGDVPHVAARTSITMAAERAFPFPFKIDNRLLAEGKSSFGLLPDEKADPSNPLRQLSFDMGSTAVTVTGMVPTPEIRGQLEEGLRLAYPSRSIRNQLTVDRRAKPEAWVPNLGGFFQEFSSRSRGSGTVKLSGREAVLTGIAPNSITRDALGFRLEKALGRSFTVFNRMEIDVKRGGRGYDTIPIYFKFASSKVTPEEAPKLNEAVRAIQRLRGTPTVLIKGFASSVGSPEKNEIISKKRAEAVRQELIRQGISENQMMMFSVGASQSASGDRAEDRRVELIILD